jgi:hypothetical protein
MEHQPHAIPAVTPIERMLYGRDFISGTVVADSETGNGGEAPLDFLSELRESANLSGFP